MPEELRPTHGYEFMAAIIQYAHVDGKFVPSMRCSVGAIPIHKDLVSDPSAKEATQAMVAGIASDLVSKFILECGYTGESEFLTQCSASEVTAKQLHDIANKMEGHKLNARIYATTKDGKVVYSIYLDEIPKPES